MRLLIYSDLHNEFEPFEPDLRLCDIADVIVLAGDIDFNHRGVDWAKALSTRLNDKPVIMVAGNHEFYGGHFDWTLAEMRDAAAGSNVHVLENDSLVIEDVRFLGCSLWTDFRLYGEGESMFQAVESARRRMVDFRRITFGSDGEHELTLQPFDTVERHLQSRAWLGQQLAIPFSGPTVVVTHHAPSGRSIALAYKGEVLSPAFASEMEDMMGEQIALWIHGHVHDTFDYDINGTRVVCNPRGYAPDELNPAFVQAMFVDV